MVGTGLGPFVVVKFRTFEVPPPGAGLVTVTARVPAEARAAAGIGTDRMLELRLMPVLTAVVPKLTVEAAVKFVPLIVSVKGALPVKEVLGEIVVIAGIGLSPAGLPVEPPVLELYWAADPQPARSKPEMIV
jgi:hypothetical protein